MASGDLSEYHARLGCDPLRDAFSAHRPLRPWSGRRAIPEAEQPERFARLLASPRERRKRLAHVHVPFCANHRPFRGFHRGPAPPAAVNAHAAPPIAELEREAGGPGVSAAPVHAVHLGGGTPHSLPAGNRHRLVVALRRCLPLAPDSEITVEGRVLGFEPEKLDARLEAGVARGADLVPRQPARPPPRSAVGRSAPRAAASDAGGAS